MALGLAAFLHAPFARAVEMAVAFLLIAVVTLAGSDWFDEHRREPQRANDPGEPLTMIGPVWVEHPEADAARPPRRFTWPAAGTLGRR